MAGREQANPFQGQGSTGKSLPSGCEEESKLLTDYDRNLFRAEQARVRVGHALIIGLFVTAGIGAYCLMHRLFIPAGPAWIAPFICLATYCPVIYNLYAVVAHTWDATLERGGLREGTLRFSLRLPSTPSIDGFCNIPAGSSLSRSAGRTLVGGHVLLTMLVLISGATSIYRMSHVAGTMFLLIYSALAGSLALVASIRVAGVADLYRRSPSLRDTGGDDAPTPSYGELPKVALLRLRMQTAWAWLLPRPWDIVIKSPYLLLGSLSALLTVGLRPAQLPVVNALFADGANWTRVNQVPLWVVWGLALTYFAVCELLLQQAKLTWDDLHDVGRDRLLLQNRRRAVASGRLPLAAARRQVPIRWTLALLLGYLLGGPVLLLAFALISAHQILYVKWAKPRGGEHPLLLLILVSWNVALRFFVGTLAVTAQDWSFAPLLLLLVMFYFWSFGPMSALWKMEAEHQLAGNRSVAIRPQSAWYLRHGVFWQRVGLVAALLLAGGVLLLQVLVTSCAAGSLLHDWYAQCTPNGRALRYAQLSGWQSFILLSLCLIVSTSTAIVLVWTASRRSVPQSRAVHVLARWKTPVASIFLAAGATCCCVALIIGSSLSLLLGFFLLSVGYLPFYEGLSYRSYTVPSLRQHLPSVAKREFRHLWRSVSAGYRRRQRRSSSPKR